MASDTSTSLKLQQFIRDSAGQPFDWLDRNCGFWVCEWVKIRTGKDPVSKYRDRFKTPISFNRFIVKNGGNEAFSRHVALDAKLVETYSPCLGDIGLVHGDGATMAIKADSDNWVVKTTKGIAVAPFNPIIAWAL